MNKIWLSILAGVMMIGSASALPSQAERKEMCNANSDEFVWVEENNVCIPKKPCQQSGFERYCRRTFKEIQLGSVEDAKKLIQMYLKRKGVHYTSCEADNPGVFGQDYIRCHISDGSYLEFEFDDLSDHSAITAKYGFAKGICAANDGRAKISRFEDLGFFDKDHLIVDFGLDPFMAGDEEIYGVACYYINEATCKEIYSDHAVYYANKKMCLWWPQGDAL